MLLLPIELYSIFRWMPPIIACISHFGHFRLVIFLCTAYISVFLLLSAPLFEIASSDWIFEALPLSPFDAAWIAPWNRHKLARRAAFDWSLIIWRCFAASARPSAFGYFRPRHAILFIAPGDIIKDGRVLLISSAFCGFDIADIRRWRFCSKWDADTAHDLLAVISRRYADHFAARFADMISWHISASWCRVDTHFRWFHFTCALLMMTLHAWLIYDWPGHATTSRPPTMIITYFILHRCWALKKTISATAAADNTIRLRASPDQLIFLLAAFHTLTSIFHLLSLPRRMLPYFINIDWHFWYFH